MNAEEAKLAKRLIEEQYKDRPPIVAKDLGDPGMNIGEAIEARRNVGKLRKWEQRYQDRVIKLRNMEIVTIQENEDYIDFFGNKYEHEDIIDITETGICPKCGSESNIAIAADSGGYDYIRYQCLECKAIFEIGWSTL